MFSEIKSLATKSAIYGAGDLFLKAISFLLLPLYTRLLDPSDYGIWALANVVSSVASIFISLSIHGFIPVIYFDGSGEKERRENTGTLFVSVVLLGGAIALLLDQLGSLLLPMVVRDVPFHPYIRLAIWTTYLTSWGLIPLRLLQTQERSSLYVIFSLLGSLLQIGLALWFLARLRWGVTRNIDRIFDRCTNHDGSIYNFGSAYSNIVLQSECSKAGSGLFIASRSSFAVKLAA
jgi:O-antigen/teichoic acid export membrane protein